ncbi:MAG: argininosuccinate lyase [Anaerolineales bacterium]|nr:argininosuccinate lyase [Anaerolineales bacterium]
MTLWGGRFKENLDKVAWQLNSSLPFDQRMALQDICCSEVWADGLQRAGILTEGEHQEILRGLQEVRSEFQNKKFKFAGSDEDIHTAIERRLAEVTGPVAGKLHSGRSRNDQVATDFRLWIIQTLPELDSYLAGLQAVLIDRAETDMEILMPGYTHLQRAQPILLSHWWLSHFWPLQRDRERFAQMVGHLAALPLGSGALAGSTFQVDRKALSSSLGFATITKNSLDAVSDRDFVAEFLFNASLTGIHLSKLAEAIVLFTTSEFGFFELADAFSTGSSLMPQKKNPDVFELTRGKAGTLLGLLTGLMTTLKGLPSTYDKDLQEDKIPVFAAFDTLAAILPVISGALETIKTNPVKMSAAIDPSMMATDLADYLVMKGIAFREAHTIAGKAVQAAADEGIHLDKLSIKKYQNLSPVIEDDVYEVFNPKKSVERRNVSGGTAPEAVKIQLAKAKSVQAILHYQMVQTRCQ